MAVASTKRNVTVILACLLAVIYLPSGINAQYTMNETCLYVTTGYIGDPTNCSNWGYCQNGGLAGSGTCKSGFLYDSTLGICNYAANVTCRSNVNDICQSQTEPGYIGNPNNCNQYCYCSNGQTQCFLCPRYQVFNPDLDQCVWATGYTCPANSICRVVQNNQFVGDPNICGNYIRCQNGGGVSTKCGAGNFNPRTGNCDTNYNVCSGTGTGNNPPVLVPASTACKAYAGTGTVYMSDQTTCYGYYGCTSTSAGTWGSCPSGTQFNPGSTPATVSGTCVTPYTFNCAYGNRCQNLNLNFVADPGCLTYTVCSNGQPVVSNVYCNASNPAFPYFNEYGQGCQATQPTQTICTLSST